MKKQIKNKEEKQLKNWMLDTKVFSWFFVILSMIGLIILMIVLVLILNHYGVKRYREIEV